jgi:predicted CoA-binding protein
MNHDQYSNDYLAEILGTTRTIAVVGASPNAARPVYGVMRFLIGSGYTVFPVNPGQAGKDILGQTTFGRLADVPQEIDMVDVFRASDAIPGLVDEILALERLPKVIWMQLGIRNDQAAAKAEAAGIKVVMNRCPAIEHPRLAGKIRTFAS